jgi:hypothetical protein
MAHSGPREVAINQKRIECVVFGGGGISALLVIQQHEEITQKTAYSNLHRRENVRSRRKLLF